MKAIFTAIGLATLFAAPALAAPHEGRAFIADYDADRDGQVTQAEFDAARTARFNATDANGDGWVSEDEYVAEYTGRLEKQMAASKLTDGKKAENRQRQLRQTHVRFGVLDTSKDKKMQKAEYDASGTRAFAEMDAYKDGVITAKDAEAAKARQAARQSQRDVAAAAAK